jgi:hypothetical protein
MAFKGWPDTALAFYEGLEADNSKAYWLDHKEVFERDVKGPMDALMAEHVRVRRDQALPPVPRHALPPRQVALPQNTVRIRHTAGRESSHDDGSGFPSSPERVRAVAAAGTRVEVRATPAN